MRVRPRTPRNNVEFKLRSPQDSSSYSCAWQGASQHCPLGMGVLSSHVDLSQYFHCQPFCSGRIVDISGAFGHISRIHLRRLLLLGLSLRVSKQAHAGSIHIPNTVRKVCVLPNTVEIVWEKESILLQQLFATVFAKTHRIYTVFRTVFGKTRINLQRYSQKHIGFTRYSEQY